MSSMSLFRNLLQKAVSVYSLSILSVYTTLCLYCAMKVSSLPDILPTNWLTFNKWLEEGIRRNFVLH
jgi:hypothetical protein